jgi:hypothetical protein
MFRPYLAILRQLFTSRNRHAALVLKSKYFNAIAFQSFTLKYCHVCGGTRDEMTGSSSDDWILLALRLQLLSITRNYNAIAIPHTLQSLFTLIFCPILHLQFTAIAPRRTALVPIRFSTESHTPYITTLQHTYSLHITR